MRRLVIRGTCLIRPGIVHNATSPVVRYPGDFSSLILSHQYTWIVQMIYLGHDTPRAGVWIWSYGVSLDYHPTLPTLPQCSDLAVAIANSAGLLLRVCQIPV